MSDDDRFMEAMIGLGVWQAAAAARQNAEYQRQQLNLLRRHQGLPPIPPDPPSHQVANTILVMLAAAGLLAALLLAAVLVDVITIIPALLVGCVTAWLLLGVAAEVVGLWIRRSNAAFYERWRRAGCP